MGLPTQDLKEPLKSIKEVDWAYLKSALVWIIPPTLVGVFGLIASPDRVMIVFVYSITIFYGIIWIFNQKEKFMERHIQLKINENNLLSRLGKSFTNKDTFIKEIMQNAQRSGATQLEINTTDNTISWFFQILSG